MDICEAVLTSIELAASNQWIYIRREALETFIRGHHEGLGDVSESAACPGGLLGTRPGHTHFALHRSVQTRSGEVRELYLT